MVTLESAKSFRLTSALKVVLIEVEEETLVPRLIRGDGAVSPILNGRIKGNPGMNVELMPLTPTAIVLAEALVIRLALAC
jgi:hypothetical protein